MNDNFFSACIGSLVIAMACAATLTPIVPEATTSRSAAAEIAEHAIVQLPTVVVTGKRSMPSEAVAMATRSNAAMKPTLLSAFLSVLLIGCGGGGTEAVDQPVAGLSR